MRAWKFYLLHKREKKRARNMDYASYGCFWLQIYCFAHIPYRAESYFKKKRLRNKDKRSEWGYGTKDRVKYTRIQVEIYSLFDWTSFGHYSTNIYNSFANCILHSICIGWICAYGAHTHISFSVSHSNWFKQIFCFLYLACMLLIQQSLLIFFMLSHSGLFCSRSAQCHDKDRLI